jgi:hypothetical protein
MADSDGPHNLFQAHIGISVIQTENHQRARNQRPQTLCGQKNSHCLLRKNRFFFIQAHLFSILDEQFADREKIERFNKIQFV